MSERREGSEPAVQWGEVLGELRQIRRHVARSEEELWDAVDEIRGLLVDRADRRSAEGGDASSDAGGSRMRPADYRRMKRRLRRFVTDAVAEGAGLAVVSRGDEELLDLPFAGARHFPRNPRGGYAGFYPADGTSLVAHLEWVRAMGAEYLLFPATADWWFEAFPRFTRHLEARYTVTAREEGVGVLYALERHASRPAPLTEVLDGLLEAWERAGDTPALLDWDSGLDLAAALPSRTVFNPSHEGEERLPYMDGSVEVVVVRSGDRRRLAEARRVACRTVVRLSEATGNGNAASVAPHFEHVGDPPPGLPSASIVIPTYNGTAHLGPCLRALASVLPMDFQGEVLVVDDGSGTETREALASFEEGYPWMRVVRNTKNLGFIESCNRGAREAEGEYLVFLNDDTVPLPGWLEGLIQTFRQRPSAGAVGGRLVYPDGSLQEAGGVIYRDGSGANVGRGAYQADGPLYQHVREVDYCSGALLATPRRLFEESGGFDKRYRPAYYEDTDYCFRVRAAGRPVFYQPASTVVHTEGATSGTDLGSGVKRHQVRNQEVFRRRWARVLDAHPEPPTRYTDLTWSRLALTGRPA